MATIRKDNPETDDPDYTIETDGDGCSVWLIVGEHLLLIDGDRIEVYDPAVLKGYQEFAYQNGVFSRPFLNYLYAMVPYIIDESELVQVLSVMKKWFHLR